MALAYIAAPYWTVPESDFTKLILLVVTLVAACFWAYSASSELEVRIPLGQLWTVVSLFIIVLLINFKPLLVELPWRGDEDYHVRVLQHFAYNIVPLKWLCFTLVFILLAFFYTVYKNSKHYIWLGIASIVFFIIFGYLDIIPHIYILRYPFFSRFVQVIPVLITDLFAHQYLEWIYRVVPFLSSCLIVVVCALFYPSAASSQRILWGLAIASMPLMHYYSSILYLEMPVVLCMVIVSYQIEPLLKAPLTDIKKNPAWYALLLIGFIKETSIVFLILIVMFRWVIQFRLWFEKGRLGKKDFFVVCKNEIFFAFLTCTPLFIYLVYRINFGTSRKTAFGLNNLAELSNYLVLVRSFGEQFGMFCVLFVIGCIMLVKKRKYILPLFSLSLIASSSAFYILDNPIYTGYSRFNLMIVPVVIVLASNAFICLSGKKVVNFLLLITILGVNAYLSPINLDGTKRPMWGSYLVDTAEHYYPYEDTLLWVKKHHERNSVLFTGLSYPYYFAFYFNKLEWSPRYGILKANKDVPEEESLKRVLKTAQDKSVDVIVFQFLEKKIPVIPAEAHYHYEKIIENDAHKIGVMISDFVEM